MLVDIIKKGFWGKDWYLTQSQLQLQCHGENNKSIVIVIFKTFIPQEKVVLNKIRSDGRSTDDFLLYKRRITKEFSVALSMTDLMQANRNI